jgi:hypothetical protein
VRATLPPADIHSVTAFSYDDLPDVMCLYDETNAGRSGTTVRSPEYWQSQLEWLQEDRDGFLISRTDEGALAGYVRSRAAPAGVEILELGVRAGDAESGRALLSAAAVRSGGRLQDFLPLSLRTLLRAHEGEVTIKFGPMGRIFDLAAALEPTWLRRMRNSGGRDGTFQLATSVGSDEVRVNAKEIRIIQGIGDPANALDERAFAHLLFRGFDEDAEARLGVGQDLSLLRTLFPEQDFVVWGSDAF